MTKKQNDPLIKDILDQDASGINRDELSFWPHKPFLRSAYNYDTKAASDESGLSCPEPTLAQQQFADDNDPNLIMERYARTGDLSLLQARSNGVFGDFTTAPDYREALNRVTEAQSMFSQLSAKVRARFNNDPAEFLEFFNDSSNLEEAVKLGLIDPDAPSLKPAAPATPKTVKGEAGASPKGETPAAE